MNANYQITAIKTSKATVTLYKTIPYCDMTPESWNSGAKSESPLLANGSVSTFP
jgi:hypothetical protein